MPSSRRQKSLSKSVRGLSKYQQKRCTAPTTYSSPTNITSAALPLSADTATAGTDSCNQAHAPFLPHSGGRPCTENPHPHPDRQRQQQDSPLHPRTAAAIPELQERAIISQHNSPQTMHFGNASISKHPPHFYSQPHPGIYQQFSSSSISSYQPHHLHHASPAPSSSSFSSPMQQTSRQHIHSTYVSHLPPPSRHLVYQPRPSSGLLSASSTVEHHPHGTQPCHNARESSYYICHRGPSTHAESPLTAPAVLYTQSEPSSALPILPEHQHAMTRSHHHPYSQPLGHSTGHDYPHGSNAGLHPTSVHQSHAAVPSSSSAMSGLSAASRSYLTEGRPLTAEEKELKRKVSHSAIEKRRRERTNTVLRELQSIIPGLSKSGKIQKLEILEAAAEYIRDLTTEPKPNDKVETGSSHAGHLGSKKQRRKRMNCSQEYGSALDSLHAPRVLTESTPLETVMEQQQHPAVATPMSVSSNASSDDSSDDALANNLPKPAPDLHSSSPDPSSMKVNFLLCKE